MKVSRYVQSVRFKPCFVGAALLIATGVSSSAATVDLSGLVNADLTTYFNGSVYPQNGGPITIGGIDFQLSTLTSGKTGVIQTSSDPTSAASAPFDILDNEFGVTTVYTIVNSAFGEAPHTAGQITFNGSLGNAFTYTYTEGDNVRDHATTGFNISAPNVFATMDFGSGDRLDVQKIILPSIFATESLTSMDFGYVGDTVPGNGEAFLAAITTSNAVATPLPATLPMFAAALGGFGLLGWRRKRKAQAAATVA
jgi:hypothetical protein